MDAVPLDVPLATRVAAGLVPVGPVRSREDAATVVAGLRAAAQAAPSHVSRVSELPLPHQPGVIRVVDRAGWVAANASMAQALLDAAAAVGGDAGSPAAGGASMWSRVQAWGQATGNAVQLAAVFSALSGRVLGQYLPFGNPQLVLVAPNVARMEAELGVDPADFRLWVCLHEQTHQLQFAAAPWLGDVLTGYLAAFIDEAPGATHRVRPASALDVVLSPPQRIALDQVSAVMSLLEGYADVMMDRVGPDVVPSVAVLRRRFETRRGDGGAMAVLARLFGLQRKLAQYRDGAAFCSRVIDAVGVSGLNAVYSGPEALPSLSEIHAPLDWVARVHDRAGPRAGGGS